MPVHVVEGPVLVDGEERVGHVLEDLQHLAVGRFSLRLRLHRGGHVEEGQHRPGDEIVRAAVGQDADQVSARARRIADLALHRAQGAQHAPHVGLQLAVADARTDMSDRPAQVGLDQVEDIRHRRREALHPQIVVQEDRGDLGAFEQVLQVGVGPGEVVDPVGQLAVDGLQLLIEGLQLLLRGLQLLVGRLQLLVDGLVFFVGGLQLLVGAFQLLDGGLEAFLGQPELGLQPLDVLVTRDIG